MKCSECGAPIVMQQKYMKHNDGTILCVECFNKLIKEGEIE